MTGQPATSSACYNDRRWYRARDRQRRQLDALVTIGQHVRNIARTIRFTADDANATQPPTQARSPAVDIFVLNTLDEEGWEVVPTHVSDTVAAIPALMEYNPADVEVCGLDGAMISMHMRIDTLCESVGTSVALVDDTDESRAELRDRLTRLEVYHQGRPPLEGKAEGDTDMATGGGIADSQSEVNDAVSWVQNEAQYERRTRNDLGTTRVDRCRAGCRQCGSRCVRGVGHALAHMCPTHGPYLHSRPLQQLQTCNECNQDLMERERS